MLRLIQKSLVLTVLAPAILTGSSAAAPATKAPRTTYAQNRCGGAPASWGRQGLMMRDELFQRLDIKPSGFQWNGVSTDKATLRRYLIEMSKLSNKGLLTVIFARNTDCATVAAVRRMISETLPCQRERLCVETSLSELNSVLPPH
ncbi:MAG: hypothetical protein ABI471_02155 [Sphingomonas bacterium]